uniref:Pre-hexon-linking protein VIII n=1 Tax=Psittacine aviadenovirus B TaxID=2169709 RepID=A0AB38ZPC9_9ADEN
MNLLKATPTEYVWKYNPLSGIPAGAQQNYGATVDWVLPGGRTFAEAAEHLRQHALDPAATRALVTRFEAESDQQPYANNRETNQIVASVLASGPSKRGHYPLEFSGRERVQLAGGRWPLLGGKTEGRIQLSGGLTEGRTQLAGGYGARVPVPLRPPRWSGAEIAGNGLPEPVEAASDQFKYFLRVQGPSAVIDEPGVYSQRAFMTTYLPAVVPHPFAVDNSEEFPAQYSALYKGRTAFEPVFWNW